MSHYLEEHLRLRREFNAANQIHARERRLRNSFFHEEVNRLVASQVAPNSRVVDIGCSDGSLLQRCQPRVGVGIDIDESALLDAAQKVPQAQLEGRAIEEVTTPPLAGPDYIIMSMLLDEVYDGQSVLKQVNEWCDSHTRLILVTYSRLWRPLLKVAEMFGLKVAAQGENYIPRVEVENLLELSGFEVTKRLEGVLAPIRIPVVSRLVNRWIAPIPIVRSLCMVHVTVARARRVPDTVESITIVVAARNEAGHIEDLVRRIPVMAPRQEVILVEGGSSDDTWAVIQEAERQQPRSGLRLVALQQTGIGKGDAVRTGFAAATGDVLMILDADLSVPPEELPKFLEALVDGACEFANGSRLVYPMEKEAMRLLNLLGNRTFGVAFSYLLGQPVRDTLCGTKVVHRSQYQRIAANRCTFGEFDPFGDFDLLFGASALGLRIRDVPVHYKERTYGTTNISRFRHGLLLLRMCGTAARRLKFVG